MINFFFNDTATPEIYTLSLHDALPIFLLRAVLKRELGLRTSSRLSHVFHMTLPGSNKALSITDAVINVQPTIIDKVHIARNAIDLMHALGYEMPRMAVLSGTEEVTRSMPSSQDAAEIG